MRPRPLTPGERSWLSRPPRQVTAEVRLGAQGYYAYSQNAIAGHFALPGDIPASALAPPPKPR